MTAWHRVLTGHSPLVRPLAAFTTGLFLLLIPIRVISYGFLPFDDALRHAAKAISGKTWQEILVLRPGVMLQDHPGWHLILEKLHALFGWDARQLVIASVVFLFVAFSLPAFACLKRKEAWALSLLVIAATNPVSFLRLFLGRPYLISMTALALVLFRMDSMRKARSFSRDHLIISAAVALATWTHGQWYLFFLPAAACLLARDWKIAWSLSICVAAGSLAGAVLTGRPLPHLVENLEHALEAFRHVPVAGMRVREFQPFDGYPWFLPAAGVILGLRLRSRSDVRASFDNPVFMLAAMGYLLGFFAGRFWYDWGLPAFVVWLSMEFQDLWPATIRGQSWLRVAAALVIGGGLLRAATDNSDHRFDIMAGQRLSHENEKHRPALPGKGGIVYSPDMAIFYRTFFENPNAPWRYALGFEPAMMTRANLEVFTSIHDSARSPESFAPWVDIMRPEDRLMVWDLSASPPEVTGLRWHRPTPEVWSGSLLKTTPEH